MQKTTVCAAQTPMGLAAVREKGAAILRMAGVTTLRLVGKAAGSETALAHIVAWSLLVAVGTADTCLPATAAAAAIAALAVWRINKLEENNSNNL